MHELPSPPDPAAPSGALPQDRTARGIAALLRAPGLWRGRQSVATEVWRTGFAALDAALPGGGWPRIGLVEILTTRPGQGELQLLAPLLAQLTQLEPPRWIAWIAPPFEPYAPGLAARGIAVERQLVIRTSAALWALEQALGSGACELALAWAERVPPVRLLRRLQLASERGRTPGFLFRNRAAGSRPSPATLRMALAPLPDGRGLEVELLKSRGGARGPWVLQWPSREPSAAP
ncbi:MAG: translesion DNA synthesis-associated protein ImuA [Gammaproteobacteria bacterium]|nr:translesion DNA synthesis-associated protein ImuA [Gammaproteobacteria bacterium]